MKKTDSTIHKTYPTTPSVFILFFGALILIFQLGYIGFDLFNRPLSEQLGTILLYRKYLEHIALEAVLIICGALASDIVIYDASFRL